MKNTLPRRCAAMFVVGATIALLSVILNHFWGWDIYRFQAYAFALGMGMTAGEAMQRGAYGFKAER